MVFVCCHAGRADAARRDVLLVGGPLGRAGTSTAFESTSCACSRAWEPLPPTAQLTMRSPSRRQWRGCRGLMRANRSSCRRALIGRWLGCARGASGAEGYPGYLKLAVAHARRSALSTVRCMRSSLWPPRRSRARWSVPLAAASCAPRACAGRAWCKPSSRAKGTDNAAKDTDAPSRGADTRA
jgi:hypothetical protein